MMKRYGKVGTLQLQKLKISFIRLLLILARLLIIYLILISFSILLKHIDATEANLLICNLMLLNSVNFLYCSIFNSLISGKNCQIVLFWTGA